MKYYKWSSDDGLYMIEKFVGDVSLEFVELSDKYSLDPIANKVINVISDLRNATFERVPLNEALNLSEGLLRVIPKNTRLKLAMVIDPNKSKDEEKIFKYVERLQESDFIQAKVHDSMNNAYQWLNIPSLTTKPIDNKFQEWNS